MPVKAPQAHLMIKWACGNLGRFTSCRKILVTEGSEVKD